MRQWIAAGIVGLSIGAIGVASTLSIVLASDEDRPEMTRLVFASVLPLFGTWVGTVLAFYFARENLQAATDSTIRLAERLDTTTPVSQVMIPRAQMRTHDLQAGEDPSAVTLVDLQAEMAAAGFRRIPVLTPSGAVLYVVHDSTIARFAESVGKKVNELVDETLGELVGDPDLGPQVTRSASSAPTPTSEAHGSPCAR